VVPVELEAQVVEQVLVEELEQVGALEVLHRGASRKCCPRAGQLM
jgi:hypothetical protein